MTFFRTAVIVAGISLAFTLVDISLTRAQIEYADPKGVDEAVAVPIKEPETTSSADKAVKKKVVKKGKKGSAKKSGKAIVEKIPDEKLTVKQVMVILKTTRDFSGKNLSGLQLVGINLGKCNMKGSDLSHANLERADLGESDLERADLTGANLKMSNLRLSGMTGAKLENAILNGAIWKDGMVCANGSIGQCREFAPTSFGK